MLILLIIFYVLFAVSGSTLMKLGSSTDVKTLFTIPFINFNVSLMMLFGIICYGISFLLYIFMLSKMELSFIYPVVTGIVYILLMVTAIFIFKEPMTALKISGSSLILVGVILMAIK